jgi:hypothetical protein
MFICRLANDYAISINISAEIGTKVTRAYELLMP